LPKATSAIPLATAAAEPFDEPPGIIPANLSYGLCGVPKYSFKPEGALLISVLVVARFEPPEYFLGGRFGPRNPSACGGFIRERKRIRSSIIGGQDIESGSTVGLAAHRRVGEN